METDNTRHYTDTNPDPITGKPGAHPVGTGVGAASFGAIGTATGVIIGGPIGGALGAVVGSVAGGLVGKGMVEAFDPTVEYEYWQDNYRSRDYVDPEYNYSNDYANAYRIGYEGYANYMNRGMAYAEAEPHLRADYERRRGRSRLPWAKARYATQDAWNRLEQAVHIRCKQDDYWRDRFQSRPYVETGYTYDHYAPAYRLGYNSYTLYGQNQGLTYEQARPQIRNAYEQHYGQGGLGWEKAQHAVRDAWNRMQTSRAEATHRSRYYAD